MNVEQARNKLAVAEYDLKEAREDLSDKHMVVKFAEEAVKFAEGDLQDAIANEPTEDKVIDMNPFIGLDLIMRFWDDGFPMEQLGYLHNILTSGENKYLTNNGSLFKHCKPIFHHDYASMTGWFKPPIPEGYIIEYVSSGHYTIFTLVDDYDKLSWSDVRIFRIVAIKHGFKHE